MELRKYIHRGERGVFARRVGIETGYLNQICAGLRHPPLALALKISAATGGQVSIEELHPLEEPYPLAARLRASDPILTRDEIARRALQEVEAA